MGGHQLAIQQPAQRQPHSAAYGTSSQGVGSRLGGNHPGKLPAVHSNSPHSPVLPGSGRYAHGNAVDDVQHRNQGNDCQEAIDEQAERKKCAPVRLLPTVQKLIPSPHQIMDSLRVFIRCVRYHLDTGNAVSFLAGKPDEGFVGANQDYIAICSPAVGERTVGHHSGDLHCTAAQRHRISHIQRNVLVPDTQDIALISVDLLQVTAAAEVPVSRHPVQLDIIIGENVHSVPVHFHAELRRDSGRKPPPEDIFDAGHFPHFLHQVRINQFPVFQEVNVNIRTVRLCGQHNTQQIHQNGETEKQNNAQGEGPRHQEQALFR